MKKILIITMAIFMMATVAASAKTYDLVLVHGLTNKHQWSDAFLDKVASIWGSGNVYVIYTNESTRVWTRSINGRTIYFCGENDFSAGDDTIYDQATLMRTKITKLNSSYGLSAKFNVIAHSMGGLVSRCYIKRFPNTVAGLVTLGTPHQGSPLANVAAWLSFFIGAEAAANQLKPAYVKNTFNPAYPVVGAPLADSGKIYTIGGDGDGWDCWGWGGELQLGWDTLTTVYWKDSDGAVARGDEQISGATHVATFWSYDHMELVTKADVATKAAAYLR
ncbi:MAG TPA: alpha/beta fold hydrolase [Spirochaetota bacterium]|nr:alpha/beta fold hydrolase [Spirochaetota bacterium]HNT10169.1 alpha/beta fold hydrolase [Spirochaetota bacterium]HNV47735.1 alpha/beta fold hydrolase [Spirochaetota bacterium]HOS38279.1 alpha/beta fold hydrolase [Spirochaetota bacterium]HPU88197.1 alpha/beta fold hydrolase [Spirochaetota bacterium]